MKRVPITFLLFVTSICNVYSLTTLEYKYYGECQNVSIAKIGGDLIQYGINGWSVNECLSSLMGLLFNDCKECVVSTTDIFCASQSWIRPG